MQKSYQKLFISFSLHARKGGDEHFEKELKIDASGPIEDIEVCFNSKMNCWDCQCQIGVAIISRKKSLSNITKNARFLLILYFLDKIWVEVIFRMQKVKKA